MLPDTSANDDGNGPKKQSGAFIVQGILVFAACAFVLVLSNRRLTASNIRPQTLEIKTTTGGYEHGFVQQQEQHHQLQGTKLSLANDRQQQTITDPSIFEPRAEGTKATDAIDRPETERVAIHPEEQQPQETRSQATYSSSMSTTAVNNNYTDVALRDLRFQNPSPLFAQKENNFTKKSWFVWHPGPGKISTTTVQHDFTYFQDEGLLDSYNYSGKCIREGFCGRGEVTRLMASLQAGNCAQQWTKARNAWRNERKEQAENMTLTGATETRQSLYSFMINNVDATQCPAFENLLDILNDLHEQGKNVAVSDEQHSYRTRQYSDFLNLLQEMLGDGWNFMTVLGYRYWFDYLPSRKWQGVRNARADKKAWPSDGGPLVHPLYPGLAGKTRFGDYTDTLLNGLVQSQLPIRIFNMNSPTSTLRSMLFCDIFPDMNNACQKSLEMDAQERGKEPMKGVMPDFECGMLACAAKDAGLISSTISRQEASRAVCEYKGEIMRNENYTFPMTCPSLEDMQFLLNTSLTKEKAIMPALYSHSEFGKAYHEQQFWKRVETKKYCTINHNVTLEQDRWKSFFAKLQPAVDARRRYSR